MRTLILNTLVAMSALCILAGPALALDAAALPAADPATRLVWAVAAAGLIHRALHVLKVAPGVLPARLKPHLPILGGALGLIAGLLDAVVGGASWQAAAVTALAGALGPTWMHESASSLAAMRKHGGSDA